MTQEEIKATIQKLANATKTYCDCSGHKKAERNQYACEQYTKQLTAEGVAIPSRDELYEMGVFNGDGAS